MRRNWTKQKYRPRSQVVLSVAKTFGQINEENILREDIENLEFELQRIDHVRNCERCMTEAVLGIERYMGSRLPWYLDLVNDVSNVDSSFNDFSETGNGDCPRPEDFDIGWYGNDCRPGTTEFIKARLEWAEKTIRHELSDRQTCLGALQTVKAW